MGITFKETILGNMYTEYDNWEQLQEGVTAAVERSVDSAMEAYEDFSDTVEEAMEIAGTSIDTFSEDAEEDLYDGSESTLPDANKALRKIFDAAVVAYIF